MELELLIIGYWSGVIGSYLAFNVFWENNLTTLKKSILSFRGILSWIFVIIMQIAIISGSIVAYPRYSKISFILINVIGFFLLIMFSSFVFEIDRELQEAQEKNDNDDNIGIGF